MCGIVGYVGGRKRRNSSCRELRRLEYRGYDSAGVATSTPPTGMQGTKSTGRIEHLDRLLAATPSPGSIGIGHTRWATHGPATDENAHPHYGGEGAVAVAHNGVIENYQSLKDRLIAEGYRFRSQTDTEVVAHLIDSQLKRLDPAADIAAVDYQPLFRAVQLALRQLQGTYGLAILFRDYPTVLVAARLGSPLIVGVGHGEHYVASDASPLVGQTDRIVRIMDNEVALMTADKLRVVHRDQGPVRHLVSVLDADSGGAELGGFAHYMLKEIFEQPEAIRNAMRGRLDVDAATTRFGGLNLSPQQLRQAKRLILTGCGTSWHAGLVGKYQIEALARVPVEVEYASELRYSNPPLAGNSLLFAITQSGETADTLAALREIKRKGYPTMAICNVVGSTIAHGRPTGNLPPRRAGDRRCSTKAFTSQCTVLAMLAIYFGRLHHLGYDAGLRAVEQLQELRQGRPGPGDRRGRQANRREIRAGEQLPLPRPAVQFSRRPGRRPEAQGDQLRPCRRLPRGGDEAWSHRPSR